MKTVAQLVVECLEAEGVEFIFGIPGAKVDTIYDALNDSKIRLVVCRHEQNAVFMAQAYGKLTGKPGVVLVTSGPGVANMVTGLLTATTEGDPVVAIAGNVATDMKSKMTHQNCDSVAILKPVTKSSEEVYCAFAVPESIANAFRIATEPTSGACYISYPQDVLKQQTQLKPCVTHNLPKYGTANQHALMVAAEKLSQAQRPVLLLGQEASRPENAQAIIEFVRQKGTAVVSTYQAAGVIPQDLLNCFYGRIGLFKNQPGDVVLSQADLVITVGFNSAEYDPEVWNAQGSTEVIHIDYVPANIHNTYQPIAELLGDIAVNLQILNQMVAKVQPYQESGLREALDNIMATGATKQSSQGKIHPLRAIAELKKIVDEDTIICVDVGSVYMWHARYLFSHFPRQLLFSNGQQTLGVAMPWAMAAKLAFPHKKVISISGDGGFLFSAMELETAKREGIHLTHIIWTDGHYNMVAEQEEKKYQRDSGVKLGHVDIPKFAEAFGAEGYHVDSPEAFAHVLRQTQQSQGLTLIDMTIDYSDNPALFKQA